MLYDKDIREPLFDYCEEQFGKIRILEEKQMGKSRADVVMILDGLLVGIEIKSDADTYARLARQVKDYDKVYDYNIVAVGSTHALHIAEHVPEWWGIITVEEIDGKADFYFYRQMQLNPKAELRRQLELMWRPELVRIQELNALPRYKEKSKAFVMDKLAEKVAPEILKKQMTDELFERDYTLIAEEINQFRAENAKKPRRTVRKRRTGTRRRRTKKAK